MKKIREKYWGDDFIRAMVFLLLTVFCLAVIFASEKVRGSLENEVAAKYHCDAVDFSYNEDETAIAPLGYSVVCKNYTSDGHLTKRYEWDVCSKEWHEQSLKHDVAAVIFGFCGFMTFVLMLLYGLFVVRDICFMRRQNDIQKSRATSLEYDD